MKSNQKQLKINKLFKKQANALEGNDDLLDEISQLEEKLKTKQNELINVQKNNLKRATAIKKKRIIPAPRAQKIVLSNQISSLQRSLDLMSMLTGMEVKSYEVDKHCVILYHMQHLNEHKITHGLKINKQAGQNVVTKFSLPIGFNFNAVMEEFDNIMTPECLGAIRRALVAYYDRHEQFEKLKSLTAFEANVYKVLDCSYVEVSFNVESEEEGSQEVFLTLEYRVYDIRPKKYDLKESGLSDQAIDSLLSQCAIFKHKPLHKAFKQCFIDGIGQYKIPQAADVVRQTHRKGVKPSNKYSRNDDTYIPESGISDDEEDLQWAYQ